MIIGKTWLTLIRVKQQVFINQWLMKQLFLITAQYKILQSNQLRMERNSGNGKAFTIMFGEFF